MVGETDLETLLRSLMPAVDPLEYGYGTLGPGTGLPVGITAFALIREDEGLTVIAPAAELAAAGILHSPGWARICLTIHSSLEAIGMTAAIARLLGDAGISSNMVAAYCHDHVFVPWDRRHEAARLLERAGSSPPGHGPRRQE